MILPATEDRSIVVFQVWPSLAYPVRLGVAFALAAAGLVIQAVTGQFLGGLPFLAVGNLFLLVRGYDNRVDTGKFDPGADWERTGIEKLEELRKLDRQIKRWDASTLDVSNPVGLVIFVLVAGMLALLGFVLQGAARILVLDAAVLLLPHWLTGIRRILRLPGLLVKVETLHALFDQTDHLLKRHRVHLLMQLRGDETRIPEDVKFKVDIEGRHEDFLGLYGQVVLNEVQGKSYPYFYVVLVAKQGFGLEEAFRAYRQPGGITAELNRQGKVEVLVLRQTTTKKSGYHTDPYNSARILQEGLLLAEKTAAA